MKSEINNIVNESLEADSLQSVKCNFKKKPGNTYYLYSSSTTGEPFFSILSHTKQLKYIPQPTKHNYFFAKREIFF